MPSLAVPRRRALPGGLLLVLLAVLAVLPAPAHAVIGGVEAAPGEAPWTVGLIQGRVDRVAAGHFCGATLVRADTVVTAAHCVEELTRDDDDADALARPGARDHDRGPGYLPLGVFTGRVLPLRAGPVEAVRWVVTHPGYDDGAGYSNADVAVIRLRRAVPGGVPLALAAPADAANYAPGGQLSVFGWGNRARDGRTSLPRQLYRGDLERIANRRCDERYGRLFNPVSQLCAGRADGSVDSCHGDSGGPLVARRPDGAALLAGIVSYGEGCGEAGSPTVYTRVARYGPWLAEMVSATKRPPGATAVRVPRRP